MHILFFFTNNKDEKSWIADVCLFDILRKLEYPTTHLSTQGGKIERFSFEVESAFFLYFYGAFSRQIPSIQYRSDPT